MTGKIPGYDWPMRNRRKNHAKSNGYHAGIGAAVRSAVRRLRTPATATELARRLSARKGAGAIKRQAVECHIAAMVREGLARKLKGGAVEPIPQQSAT